MFFVAAHDCIRSSLFSALDELRIEIDSRVPVWFLIKPAEDAARVEIEYYPSNNCGSYGEEM